MSSAKLKIYLMGRPRVVRTRVSAAFSTDELHASASEHPLTMETLALWILSALFLDGPDVKQGKEVRREWLERCVFPDLHVDQQKVVREKIRYRVEQLDARYKLRAYAKSEGARERGVYALNLDGVTVDVLQIREAEKQKQHDEILRLAEKPLLEGASYGWLRLPEFVALRQELDAAYIDALLSRADSLLFQMNLDVGQGRSEAAAGARARAILLVDRAAERLNASAEWLPLTQSSGISPLQDRIGRLMQAFGCVRIAEERPFSQLETAAPPVATQPLPRSRVPNNLKGQMTSFVGREEEIREISDALTRKRLVTLLGSGGSGKTRLSLEIAAGLLRQKERYRGGIWFVDLSAITVPQRVPGQIAEVAGLTVPPGADALTTLTDHWADTETLLILDNCEHLIPTMRDLATTLLMECPGMTILATSREPLGVRGEQRWPVPSLSFASLEKLQGVQDLASALMACDAVKLFVERAHECNPRFHLLGHEAAVAQICYRLDGIPLAIELAAAHVTALSTAQIAERLNEVVSMPAVEGTGANVRHSTMRAAIDWSYEQLSPEERLLLARLTIFTGGWTLPAAEAICSGDDVESILYLLQRLVSKSLVQIGDPDDPDRRFRLLETIRHYGRQYLEEAGELEAMQARRLRYFVTQVEELEGLMEGPKQRAILDRLQLDWDNIYESMQWAEASGDTENGLRLCSAIWRFLYIRGYHREGMELLSSFLGRAHSLPPSVRCKALRAAGHLSSQAGDAEQARKYYAAWLTCERRRDNLRGMGSALGSLGNSAMVRGDRRGARRYYRKSLEIFKKLNDRRLIGLVYGNLGGVASALNDRESAIADFSGSVVAFRDLGDQQNLATAVLNRANSYIALCRWVNGARDILEGLSICETADYKRGLVHALFLSFVMAAKLEA